MFIGIDVGKAKLDVAFSLGEVFVFTNDSAGIGLLVEQIKPHSVELIVMEPSGGYELELWLALHKANLPVAVVFPQRIKEFAKALGRKARCTGCCTDG
jgi:transposase